MSGIRHGVASIIQNKKPNAYYTHCYGHSLNLAAAHTIKQCPTLKIMLETVHEITKLVKFSPHRQAIWKS